MPELLQFLAVHLSFLFRTGGYRFVDSHVGDSFGGDAGVVLESDVLRLGLTRDRSQLLLIFQPVAGKTPEWFSPGLLRGALVGDRGSSEVLDEQWAAFLESALPELEGRLRDPAGGPAMLAELRRQARLRAKDLFDMDDVQP